MTKKFLFMILFSLILLLFFLSKNSNNINNVQVPPINDTNWKIYKNPDFGYSIKYPNDWKLDTKGAENYSKMLKDPKFGEDYRKYPEEHGGSTIKLSDKNGNVLVFSYGYAEPGTPLHVFKYKKVLIDGVIVFKNYIDGCRLFVPVEFVRSADDCMGVDTKFYSIIYSDAVGSKLLNPVTHDWKSGNLSTYLSIAVLHGKGATIWFNIKKPLNLDDKNFENTDRILDAIISSIKF